MKLNPAIGISRLGERTNYGFIYVQIIHIYEAYVLL
jgi:hypothetical protein